MNYNEFVTFTDKILQQYFRPTKNLSISDWSAEHVFLPNGTSASAGKWKTISYQHGVFDAIEDTKVIKVTLMWGAQLGKTALLNNTIGHYIDHQPESQIMMQPSESDLKVWLETKFNPMVDYSNSVRNALAKPRGRDGVNNQKMKSYKGGFLMFAWSGSPNTMRGRSAPKIYCDEVDAYERSAEGHPVNLLWQRSATFGKKRKLILTSTPTVKGGSFIEMSYDAGDRRKYYVPCPHCEHYQTLKWSNVVWESNNSEHKPETAKYFCEECGAGITDGQKLAILDKGYWQASMPFDGHASFHLNELYSPFRKFEDIVRSFLEKKETNDLKSFVNISLAETWEELGTKVDPNSLIARVEEWDMLPDNCFFITAGIDVQLDRLEIQTVGFGVGEESWILDYKIFYGHTDEPRVWHQLSEYLDTKKFTHRVVGTLSIESSCLDTGGNGNMTSRAYEYVRTRPMGKPFAIKGKGGGGIPFYTKPTLKLEKGKRSLHLFILGVDEGKNVVYNRLGREDRQGVGVIHFKRSICDEIYFGQLTAETRIVKHQKGFPKYEWHNIATDKRNEALDTYIYALGALRIMNIDLDEIYAKHIGKIKNE